MHELTLHTDYCLRCRDLGIDRLRVPDAYGAHLSTHSCFIASSLIVFVDGLSCFIISFSVRSQRTGDALVTMSGASSHSDGQAARPMDSGWLSTHLAHHPIFSLPASSSSSQAPDTQLTSLPELAYRGRKKLLQIKGTDLLLAVNKSEDEGEVRIASILEAKKAHAQNGFSIGTATYKVRRLAAATSHD